MLCGILLHPAAHTRSPAMHNAAFAALGLDAVFLAFDVAPSALGAAVAGARVLGVRQLAISLPHKEAVLAHLEAVDDTARRIGAANTVTLRDGRFVGENTDWIGLARALERETALEGRTAVVLGAGGTARAAVFALRQRGATVHVLNRTVASAERLVKELGGESAGSLESLNAIDYDVLVNTTSVGLRGDVSPVAAGALRARTTVFDAVYDPPLTRLLRDAQTRGARIVPGKWMLVEQAVEQIHLWSGTRPASELLAEAFDAAGEAVDAAVDGAGETIPTGR
jgi:shikimate dehydrogenase